MKRQLKSFFKASIKQASWQPSIREVTYLWEDGIEYKGIEFEWYASTKDPDRWYDITEPTAFQKCLDEFMTNPQLFLQHDENKPIGNIVEAKVDNVGLWVKGIAKIDTDNVFQKLRTGVIKTMSFGYRINEFENQIVEIKWKKQKVRVIKDLELFEVSLVSVPMNAKAGIKSVDQIPEDISDEEYKTFFQTEKDDNFPLYKSIDNILQKAELDGELPEEVETETEVEEKTEVEIEENEEQLDREENEEVKTEEKEVEEEEKEVEEKEVEEEDEEQEEEEEKKLEFEAQTDLEMETQEKAMSFMEAKAQALDEVKGIAELDFQQELKFISVPNQYKNKVPQGAMYFEWVVSDDSVDRYDTRVLSTALKGKVTNFVKNGVVLLSHEKSNPIGLPLWAKVKENNVTVWGYIYDEYTDNKASKGLYRGLSIGFIPLDRKYEDRETWDMISRDEYEEKMSEVETRWEIFALWEQYRMVITDLDWLEYSFVTTPANKGTSVKLDYAPENVKNMLNSKIGWDMPENPEKMDTKQDNDLETEVKQLTESNTMLEVENKELSELLGEFKQTTELLSKELDTKQSIINKQNEMIEIAKKTRIKKGNVYQNKPNSESKILNDLQAIKDSLN